MANNKATPFQEDARKLASQMAILEGRLERVARGTPDHEALLDNLAAVAVVRAAADSLLDAAKERSFTDADNE